MKKVLLRLFIDPDALCTKHFRRAVVAHTFYHLLREQRDVLPADMQLRATLCRDLARAATRSVDLVRLSKCSVRKLEDARTLICEKYGRFDRWNVQSDRPVERKHARRRPSTSSSPSSSSRSSAYSIRNSRSAAVAAVTLAVGASEGSAYVMSTVNKKGQCHKSFNKDMSLHRLRIPVGDDVDAYGLSTVSRDIRLKRIFCTCSSNLLPTHMKCIRGWKCTCTSDLMYSSLTSYSSLSSHALYSISLTDMKSLPVETHPMTRSGWVPVVLARLCRHSCFASRFLPSFSAATHPTGQVHSKCAILASTHRQVHFTDSRNHDCAHIAAVLVTYLCFISSRCVSIRRTFVCTGES